MTGVFRLDFTVKIDGTCQSVLMYLAWRHKQDTEFAWPGLQTMAHDLNMTKGRVFQAIERLRDHHLVAVLPGRGPRSNRYGFPWLAHHRADPSGGAIQWPPLRSGGPDRSGQPDHKDDAKRSGGPDHNDLLGPTASGRVEASTAVGPARPEKEKYKKDLTSPHLPRPKTADDVFRERHAQRNTSSYGAGVTTPHQEICKEEATCPACGDEGCDGTDRSEQETAQQ